MLDKHLALCCAACRKVKDEGWDGSVDQVWCSITEYVKRNLVHAEDVFLSETYCPDCTRSYNQLMQYGRSADVYSPSRR
ncbi:hypothetical protein [Petrachloros mirabilis]